MPASPAQAAAPSSPSTHEAPAADPGASGTGPARAILQPLPALPDDLRQEAFQAVARVRLSIHPDGSVSVELLDPTRNPRLNQILLNTLAKWRFFPAMKDGHAIESSQEIRVHFNVN
ncbi:MAG TPA: energy transducer TonB [Bordetella sp.]